MITLRAQALDTWFFRESRPMETLGGSELSSLFPPPPRTFLGAVRSAIGEASGTDWRAFAQNPDHPLRRVIGYGDDVGPLRLRGPWLNEGGVRLYRMPSFVMFKTERTETVVTRLQIGEAVNTHLGRVRLPKLPAGSGGFKSAENAWVTQWGLERILAGEVPPLESIRSAAQLFREEPRLGIARNNERRVATRGLLYQTRHVRPFAELSVEGDLTLGEDTEFPAALVRFGGEGRMAYLQTVDAAAFPAAPTPDKDTVGLILVLLTPARLGQGRHGWLLPDFLRREEDHGDGERVWQGEWAGVSMTLHAAVIGKSQRQGGWDIAKRGPRDVQSLIPAGSAYYVTVEGDLAAAIRQLHGSQVGDDQPLGRGQIACALWRKNEY